MREVLIGYEKNILFGWCKIGLHTVVYLKEFGDNHPGFGAGLFGEIN